MTRSRITRVQANLACHVLLSAANKILDRSRDLANSDYQAHVALVKMAECELESIADNPQWRAIEEKRWNAIASLSSPGKQMEATQ